MWESLEKGRDAKPVVSMTKSNVDGCQVLGSCDNPIGQRIRLFDRHERIDQDGVPHAIDKGRRHRLKIRLAHIRRLVASDNRNARGHEYFPM